MVRGTTTRDLSVPASNWGLGVCLRADGWFTALTALLLFLLPGCSPQSTPPDPSAAVPTNRAAQLEARERKIDETVWAKEMVAQQCGQIFEAQRKASGR